MGKTGWLFRVIRGRTHACSRAQSASPNPLGEVTKTIEIPFLSLVTQADPDWQRDERFVQQDERRKPRIEWRNAHPYDFIIEPPVGYVLLVDENDALLRDGDSFLTTPE